MENQKNIYISKLNDLMPLSLEELNRQQKIAERFSNHSDAGVREAAGKLARDVLAERQRRRGG